MLISQRHVNENHAQHGIYLRIFTAACGSANFTFPALNVSLIILDAIFFLHLCRFRYLSGKHPGHSILPARSLPDSEYNSYSQIPVSAHT